MYVGSIIEALRAHELVNSAFGEQLDKIVEYGTSNQLPYEDRLAFKQHLNAAIRNLYARFPLKEQQLYLGCKQGIGKYSLTKEQVEGAGAGEYILDTTYVNEVGAFTENVVFITDIFDARTEDKIPLNMRGDPLSIVSLDSITLRVPNYLTSVETVLKINYRAFPDEWVGLRDKDI